MNREAAILDQAVNTLKMHTGLNTTIEMLHGEYIMGHHEWDALLHIENKTFVVEIKKNISNHNRGAIMGMIKEAMHTSPYPPILVAEYIPQDVAKEYCRGNINYLDVSGNCNIREAGLIINIEGKKRERPERTNQSRAFQEAGIKILFHLLAKPETINYTYRDLAKTAGVSLGSVASVIQELEDLNYYMKTKNGKFLKNKQELLRRWIVAYHDVLRPRLLLKKMRFTKIPERNWEELPFRDSEDVVLWGGEPAGSLLTNYLYPGKFTIYTNGFWKSLISDFHLAPAEDGQIEVLQIFWQEEDRYREKYIVPPLLVYADLIGSGNDRNIETANIIFENELSHLEQTI